MTDVDDISFRAYAHRVTEFCLWNAQVASVTGDRLTYAMLMLAQNKKQLLDLKESLGLDDGLSFLQDNLFLQFKIRDGQLQGDKSKVAEVVERWIDGNGNHYQFEVAVLAACLSGDISADDLYPAELEIQAA